MQSAKQHLFISHSTKDDDFGHQIKADLQQALGESTPIWYDNAGGLNPGVSWWTTIIQQIQICTHFIVLLSQDAYESKWVNDEVTMAWQQRIEHDIRIIPLRYRACDIRGDLRTLQIVDFMPPKPYAESFSHLLHALKEVPALAPPPKNVAMPPTQIFQPAPAPPPAHPRLRVFTIVGTTPAQTITMATAPFTIGREEDNDLILDDAAVSRHHAALVLTKDHWEIRSQPGSRLVYVNGHPCANAILHNGDQIVLGGTVIRFELPSPVAGESNREFAEAATVSSFALQPCIVVDCPRSHFVAPLRDLQIALGRDPQCGLIIPAPVVSHLQAHFIRDAFGRYAIEPEPALNPLLLRGQILQQRHLLTEDDTMIISANTPDSAVTLHYTTRNNHQFV